MKTKIIIDAARTAGNAARSAVTSEALTKSGRFISGGLKRLFSRESGRSPWLVAAWIGGAATAIGAGAAGMYFLDPASGQERRSRLARSARRAKLRSSQSAQQLSQKLTKRFTHGVDGSPELAERSESDGPTMAESD